MSRLDISENLKTVRANIAAACEKAGRDPGEVLLIGATKMNDASRVQEAIAAGLTACGENRVQEMLEKQAQGAYEGAEHSLRRFRRIFLLVPPTTLYYVCVQSKHI